MEATEQLGHSALEAAKKNKCPGVFHQGDLVYFGYGIIFPAAM